MEKKTIENFVADPTGRSSSNGECPPGTMIRVMMDCRKLSEIPGIDAEELAGLLEGEIEITRDTADILHRSLGFPVMFWMNLEATYPKYLAEISSGMGEPMRGIAVDEMAEEDKIQGRGW